MRNITYVLLKNGEPIQGFDNFPNAEAEVKKAVSKRYKVKWEQEEQGVWFWRSPDHDIWEIEVATRD